MTNLRLSSKSQAAKVSAKVEAEVRTQLEAERPSELQAALAEAEEARAAAEQHASDKRAAVLRVAELQLQLTSFTRQRDELGGDVAALDEHAGDLRQALERAHEAIAAKEAQAVADASEVAALRRQLLGALAETRGAKDAQMAQAVAMDESSARLRAEQRAELAERDAQNESLARDLEEAQRKLQQRYGHQPRPSSPRAAASPRPSSPRAASPRSEQRERTSPSPHSAYVPALSVSWTNG